MSGIGTLRVKNAYLKKIWSIQTNSEAFVQRSSVKKSVLRNFAKFTVKHLCQSLLFNNVAGLRLWHRCFSVNFVKFLRTAFFIEHLWWWLLLQIYRRELISDFLCPFKPFSIVMYHVFPRFIWYCFSSRTNMI